MDKINIELSRVCLLSKCNREIVKDLDLKISSDRVALIGRNGVGKSTLLRLIAGELSPAKGRVHVSHEPYFIEQELCTSSQRRELEDVLEQISRSGVSGDRLNAELLKAGFKKSLQELLKKTLSHGELRKLKLLAAKLTKAPILILDEPTEDLDRQGIEWLKSWLPHWQGALLVASHRRCLLAEFEHFFIMEEQGCSYFKGSFESLEKKLIREDEESRDRYFRGLNRLVEYEEHILHIARRRARKKQYGRINELGRATPRQRLNQKRDYAQFKHGRMKRIRDSRIADMRELTKSTRRSLHVDLPMTPVLPEPGIVDEAVLTLQDISYSVEGRVLFKGLNFSISLDRLAVCGANGSGKTSLLKIMTGELAAGSGRVERAAQKIGYISQGASNWMLEDSLLQCLSLQNCSSPKDTAALILSHKFPLALAERPLKSLSPGERLRAALICLFQQRPSIQLLILDEPSNSLDLPAQAALKDILRAWQGGLVISSHDSSLLQEIRVERYIQLE